MHDNALLLYFSRMWACWHREAKPSTSVPVVISDAYWDC
jgi:hypothetical protein